jgi:hypothetical protein
MPAKDDERDRETDPRPTAEVADEGGSPGNVEIGVDRGPGTGSEAGETWRPTERDTSKVVRDETGEGRRSP